MCRKTISAMLFNHDSYCMSFINHSHMLFQFLPLWSIALCNHISHAIAVPVVHLLGWLQPWLLRWWQLITAGATFSHGCLGKDLEGSSESCNLQQREVERLKSLGLMASYGQETNKNGRSTCYPWIFDANQLWFVAIGLVHYARLGRESLQFSEHIWGGDHCWKRVDSHTSINMRYHLLCLLRSSSIQPFWGSNS